MSVITRLGALCVVLLGVYAVAPPAHADLPPAACPARTLELDEATVRAAIGVQDVVMDAGHAQATVLFANGDVLRVAQTGCLKPVLVARLWTDARDGVADEIWKQRATMVSQLVLKPERAAQVTASLQAAGVDARNNGAPRIERELPGHAGYSMTVMRSAQDGLGQFLSMVYLNL
ncbi:hypothetical protein [Dyella sp. C9]|uniref:hypothetical protein n=1 Tax=Dyella sp. C9 TaxID=2202154 RepID=UPI000DEF6F4A|nr:hypothetical protein [Dyella sp. C9]